MDECAEQNGGCPQNCTNNVGNHTCSCLSGYTDVYDNGTFCTGKPWYLLINCILDYITQQQYKYFLHALTVFCMFKLITTRLGILHERHILLFVTAFQILTNVAMTTVDANISVRIHLGITSVSVYLDMISTMTAKLVLV